jgi:hypothetical protein
MRSKDVMELFVRIQMVETGLTEEEDVELLEAMMEFSEQFKRKRVCALSKPKPIEERVPVEEMPVDLYMSKQMGWSEISKGN